MWWWIGFGWGVGALTVGVLFGRACRLADDRELQSWDVWAEFDRVAVEKDAR